MSDTPGPAPFSLLSVKEAEHQSIPQMNYLWRNSEKTLEAKLPL